MPTPRTTKKKPDLSTHSFPSAQAWEKWLAEHHAASPGLWLRFARKDSGVPSVYYPQALEVALCYGWIDGQVKRLDDTHYLQRFTPRTPRSKWSKINCAKVAALIAAGRMKPAGLAAIESARADGRWAAAYDSPRTATVPDDLAAALKRNRAAGEFFATLDGRNRYAILYRLQEAKRPETRAKRLATYVAMLADQKKLHP